MIIVRLTGGMGNQLFQYALGRKLSLKYSVPLKLDTTFLVNQTSIPLIRPHFVPRPYALDLFRIHATFAKREEIPWYARPFFSEWLMQGIDAIERKLSLFPGWEKSYIFDERILSSGPNVYLAGYWQSPKYFSDIRPALLEDFVLQTPLPSHIEAYRKAIDSEISLCMHIRRKDFIGKYHGTGTQTYYDRALESLQSRTTVEKIYVFSDDIAWCKEHVRFTIPTEFVEEEYAGDRDIGHFTLMRSCKHFIISNSTFSWWAAWLATYEKKQVIAPKQWFKTRLDSSDLTPPDWIRV